MSRKNIVHEEGVTFRDEMNIDHDKQDIYSLTFCENNEDLKELLRALSKFSLAAKLCDSFLLENITLIRSDELVLKNKTMEDCLTNLRLAFVNLRNLKTEADSIVWRLQNKKRKDGAVV